MPETTENYHRIPVSSGHSNHELRTITVDSGKGIKALYCTDCKEIVTYLFDVDKWTMEEAREWVDSHKEDMVIAVVEKGDIPLLEDDDKMAKRLDRRTKDLIGSRVRYKSYGTFLPKGAGESDSDTIYVRGFFTDDKMDEVGDIITKDATVEAVERWRQWGNIRTMHDSPSGRIDRIGEADGLKWNEVVTVPVDEQTKKLIQGGVLKAYSVGIIPREYEINEEAIAEAGEDVDPWFWPLIIHSYDMVEISYVDHPANYAAAIQEVGSEKFKGMSHRTVLFKNSEIMGDNMDQVEKEAAGEQEVLDAVEDESPEVVDGEDVQPDVDGKGSEAEEPQDVEPEIEKDDSTEEEEIVEKDEEETFDVALAVGEIKGLLDGLESRVSGLVESLDELADRVVERFIDAMSVEPEQADEADEESGEDEQEEPEVEVEDKGFGFDEDAFVDRVTEKVIAGLTEILVPAATRSARVVVDEDGEELSPETSVEKTKRYLDMTPAQRRERMKEVLRRTINK